ncbi:MULTISPECIES: nucleotidyltransferase family protein [Methanosarcina]|jgi:predicted nucleotidyltransferase|uniref:protein adenylyltransferase n=1 Tax=Methanosarcina mazei TaxID=2209 RepID=A0A0F8BDK6_METMZ|nr:MULTISPECIES: nucleotidyltransferase family protein [Methanosarcina]KKF99460.1 nucleotidyltransferase [Methanosarcina mazei]KKH88763.1 nucleotidyltransferase [Methanosarcina mazei]NLO30954.1 nucleotidyltransferase family protein [Methanosarcina mazei]
MDVLQILKEHEILIKEKFGVKRIGIFGSFVRGEEKAGSDIDVLVEFDETKTTFDNYMDLKFYLEDLFKREVDLVIESSIKPRLKDNIMREVVYA